MLHLLDTNIWIALAEGEQLVRQRVQVLGTREIATCSIVRAELLYGARKSARVNENLHGFHALLAPFRSLVFDDPAASHYGIIRTILERAGTPIGGNDLLVASIALANDCVLVTRNRREFGRVPGLRLDNWE